MQRIVVIGQDEAFLPAFVQRLREEKKFESVEALVAQMQRDVEETRKVLANER